MSNSTMKNLFFKSLRSKQIAVTVAFTYPICYNHFSGPIRRDKRIGHA